MGEVVITTGAALRKDAEAWDAHQKVLRRERAAISNLHYDGAWEIEEEEEWERLKIFYPATYVLRHLEKEEAGCRLEIRGLLSMSQLLASETFKQFFTDPLSCEVYTQWRTFCAEQDAIRNLWMSGAEEIRKLETDTFIKTFYPITWAWMKTERTYEPTSREEILDAQQKEFDVLETEFRRDPLTLEAIRGGNKEKYESLLLFLSQPGAPRLDVEEPSYIKNYLRKLSLIDKEVLKKSAVQAKKGNSSSAAAYDCGLCSHMVTDRKTHVLSKRHVEYRARFFNDRKAGYGQSAGSSKAPLVNFLLRQVLPFELTHQVLAFNMEKPPVLFFRYFDSKHRPCGHLWCSLTEKRDCCACLDKRSEAEATQIYVDGEGYRTTDCRQLHYCPGCRSNFKVWKQQREEEKTGDRGAAVLNLLLDAAKR